MHGEPNHLAVAVREGNLVAGPEPAAGSMFYPPTVKLKVGRR